MVYIYMEEVRLEKRAYEAIAIYKRGEGFLRNHKHTHVDLYVFLKNKLINMYVCMYKYCIFVCNCVGIQHIGGIFAFSTDNNLYRVRPHYANKQTSPTVGRSCCCVVSIALLLFLQWLNFCSLKASHKIVPQTARICLGNESGEWVVGSGQWGRCGLVRI